MSNIAPGKKIKAVALLSGGLDSTLAVKMMIEQGIDVVALNFTSPFCTCTKKSSGCMSEALRVANEFNIPIKVMNKGVEYLEIVRKPQHGYGKGLNPCVDCRIYLLRKAKKYMQEIGADFVVTGEVLGQRPMSQRLKTLRIIEEESGLSGLLLRPLSAQHFEPGIPETNGWVDRNRLLAFEGRSRKQQFQLAEDLNVKDYPCPAGGCLLTETLFVPKLKDLFDHSDEICMNAVKLLKLGRHFRLTKNHKLILGRNEAENDLLPKTAQPEDTVIDLVGGAGPTGLLVGSPDAEVVQLAARILIHHTKNVSSGGQNVEYSSKGRTQLVSVNNNLTSDDVSTYRI